MLYGERFLGGIVRRIPLVGAIVAVVVSIALTPAQAEKRVALVIGNDRYSNLPTERQLQKAVNDAQAVGDVLTRLGFHVIRGANLSRQGMIDKLSELTGRLAPGDTAAFFYAGHGVAIAGVNYLVPSDVPAVTEGGEARVRGASVAEGDVIAEIQAKRAGVALLVLDACRDNPFPRFATRSIGNSRGLSEIKPSRGIFTIYSAGIGQAALDRLQPNDPDRNSVFTRVFIEKLEKPGLDLSGLAIEVRERVAELALSAKNVSGQPDPHEQTPAYYDQTIGGRVYLAARPIAVEATPSATSAPAAAAKAEPDQGSAHVQTGWMIQVGALEAESEAKARLDLAASMAPEVLSHAERFTEPVVKDDKTTYRARFSGLEVVQAEAACKSLKHRDIPCMALKAASANSLASPPPLASTLGSIQPMQATSFVAFAHPSANDAIADHRYLDGSENLVEQKPKIGGSFVVQLAAQLTEEDALSTFRTIQTKFSVLLSGRQPIIRKADLGEKGIFFGVQVGPFALRDDAVTLCESLKSAGGSCIVQQN